MTRCDARALWKAAGLSYADLTEERLSLLREKLDAALRAAAPIDGLRVSGRTRVVDRGGDCGFAAEIRCSASYFSGREAVTFNRDGFIGFAGWADDNVIQPFLTGFRDWVEEISHEPSAGQGVSP